MPMKYQRKWKSMKAKSGEFYFRIAYSHYGYGFVAACPIYTSSIQYIQLLSTPNRYIPHHAMSFKPCPLANDIYRSQLHPKHPRSLVRGFGLTLARTIIDKLYYTPHTHAPSLGEHSHISSRKPRSLKVVFSTQIFYIHHHHHHHQPEQDIRIANC